MVQCVAKIVFVINSLEGGGAERALALLVSLVMQSPLCERYDIHLVLLDDLEIVQELPAGITLHTLDAAGSMLRSVYRLGKKLRELAPDVVISFLTRANCAAILAGKMLGFPVLVSERVNTSSHFTGRFGWINKLLVRLLYPLATRVIAVSGGVKQDLVDNFRIPATRIDVIYNAYDLDRIRAKAAEPIADGCASPYICSVGRLVKNKNFELLVRAYAAARPPQKLMILGQGPEEARLRELAVTLGVADSVLFMGYKNNPYPYVAGSDFFVSSSDAEGFPNAIAEAMAVGRAVVATNCLSGPAEILAAKVDLPTPTVTVCPHGILVPTGSVPELASAINTMALPAQRLHFEQASMARVKDFSLQNYLNAFAGLIATVTADTVCGK